MSKTIYASKRKLKAMGISLEGYPSAGPHPSIKGMKELYWGKNALMVKSGAYIYKVPEDVYGRLY